MVTQPNKITLADIIIQGMPFAVQLVDWCDKHPDFKEALKVANPNRFIALLAVSITHTTNMPGDEVIGFFAYDIQEKNPEKKFKQDFIINVGGDYKKFKLYSKLPSKNYGLHVQSIEGFMASYGKNGHYADTHHYSLEGLCAAFKNTDLPDRAIKAVRLAERVEQNGRRELSQSELDEMFSKMKETNHPGSNGV